MTDQPAIGVLVVDPDPAVLQLLGIALTESGFAPHLASSVQQALTLCEGHRLAVGLIDADVLQDDISALARLRAVQPSMRFCLVNAGVDGPITADLDALGVVQTLSKPFGLRQLADILQDLARR
jgi:DNA-binding NtrC family response regulator